MNWNPAQYGTFIDQRTRPAVELATRIRLERPAAIVDLGCGPGNSTSILHDRWPHSALIGVDNSPEMLARANREGPQASWIGADIGTWRPAAPTDLIFSNAALHWLDHHEQIMPELIGSLSENGALAVQMPRNFDATSHRTIREVARDGPWAEITVPLERADPVGPPEFYYDILAPLCASLDIWETEYLQILEGDDAVFEWVRGTALVPYLTALDGTLLTDFKSELSHRLRAAYPVRENGKTLFPFKRIFIIAYR